MEKAIEARPARSGEAAFSELGLQLLAHTLLGETAKKDADIGALEALKKLRPEVLVVIVTNDPRRFGDVGGEDPAAGPLVMPKPAWAWTIMDAVRTRLDARPDEPRIEPRPTARRQGRHE